MGPLVIITVLFFMAYLPLQWSATKTLKRHIGPGFIISYLVPLTLGMILPSAPFFLAVILILFLATTRDRLDAACRFIMLALLMPSIIWRARIGSSYLLDITTIDVLGFALLIQCLLKPDRKAAPMRQFTAEDGFVALIFFISWIAAGRFPSISAVLRGGFTQAILLLLPYLALRRSVRSSEEFMRLAACLAVASGILATFAIYEALNGWTLFGVFRKVSDALGMSRGSQRGGILRAPATMSSALMLGMVLLTGLGAAFYSRRYVRKSWMLVGWGIVILGGIITTQSRGNTALLPLSALIFCLQRKKYGFAAMIGIGAPLGFAILMALAQVSPQIGAFLNVGAAQQTSRLTAGVYDYRQLLLQRGMEVAAMHRWTGASLSYVVDQLADITQGQGIVDMVNTYLTLYLVSGLAGMIPFFLLFATIWWKLLAPQAKKRLAAPEFNDMKGFAIATLAVVAVQLSFLSFIDRVPLCLMLALIPARMAGIERMRLGRARRIEPARSPAPPMQPGAAAEPQQA